MDIPQYRKPSMPNQAPFEGPGFFLKGNLHTHTSLTDGALGPQEVVDIYRRAGYDFIALSEHFLYVRGDQYAQNGILVMPAIEAVSYTHLAEQPAVLARLDLHAHAHAAEFFAQRLRLGLLHILAVL